MKKTDTDLGRRKALKLTAGSVALVPLATLLASQRAAAADMPHVSEDDPAAVALKYHHDASAAPRTNKAGTPAAKQHCSNCQLGQGDSGWIACSIFPGKAVNANGWCTAWVPKA